MNYQETLNLPKTDFSMRANLAQNEPTLLERWAKEDLYRLIREKSAGKTPFILHDGPPYANGHIHIGHALNKILKDMIVKGQTMQDKDAHYVPGWDCHGLPIEHQLFKELKKKKSEVHTVEFRKKAHDYAMKFVGIQKEEFQRLGVFGDWDNPYLTLTPAYEYWILKSFTRLVRDGYVTRGLKPVNWCGHCETALAEAEVEYEDHTSPSVYVKFRVNNPEALPALKAGKPLSLLIWTTTPWTLLANVAVAVHPQYDYVCVDVGQEILILEKSLSMPVLEKTGASVLSVLAEMKGTALKDLRYEHPFGVKTNCRVVLVDYITKEEGTGLVHTAPGHGQEDYQAGVENHLDILMPVNDQGVFTSDAGKFEGQHVFKANKHIIEDLEQRGLLLAAQQISHSYPHCWRCKNAVIFRATHQWFLKIDHKNLRGKLKEIIQRDVRWIPAVGEERILSMVTGRPDWCLSRQRHWGVPIPALACAGCGGEHKLFPEVIEHFAEIVQREGSDAWFEKELADLLPEGFVCPDCRGGDFTKTHDILDVWFDSGVSHQAVVGPMLGQKIPVDLFLEGSDQHRGWFQSSLIPSVAINGGAPFKAVLTHGFVVDGEGRKMSKSLGNVISPQDLIKQNGADILRLWVASSSTSEDIRLSKEIFDRVIDAYRKMRNTFRFLLGNLHGFDPDQDMLDYGHLLMIDRFALFQLAQKSSELKMEFERYEFARVIKIIYSYFNEDLSGFYLDILKDRLYTSPSSSVERRSAQTVLFQICNRMMRFLAPILTFTAEEIFMRMPKTAEIKNVSSVHLLNWLDIPAPWFDSDIENFFEPLLAIRTPVMKALEEKRREGLIGSSLEAKIVFYSASPRDLAFLTSMGDLLAAAFIVSEADVQKVEDVQQGLGEDFPKTFIEISRAVGEKCPRCWNYRVLGGDPQHPTICARCAKAVRDEDGKISHRA